MVEVKNEQQEENLREVGHLLLEVKRLAKSGALASDSYIYDKELQIQDNLISRIVELVEDVENILL